MKKIINEFPDGSYGHDVDFFHNNKIETIELKKKDSEARILLVPGYQGRVMTSTATGTAGPSFGWINHKLIGTGKINNHFNPFGGEERLWLGPEGGPFSIYFKQGNNQVFENWKVPKEIDTESFEVTSLKADLVNFRKAFSLTNASGKELYIGIERMVRLLNLKEVEDALDVGIDQSLNFVAYESENILTNKGKSEWISETGVLSIWMLSMFNPSEKGVVFIPFKSGEEKDLGRIVTDDYFGRVPSDRLHIKDNIIFFKTDGKYRSKIGISPQQALPYCGSYDPGKSVLTILWYTLPDRSSKYVNSKWGDQENPLNGDVVNSYNDGPVADGSIMGPFYEIESSSPAAFLSPGGKMVHKQRIFHISGDSTKLNIITQKLFNLSISEIKKAFNQT